jgi:predicted transcriptional regulator
MADTVTMGVKLDPETKKRLKTLGSIKDRSPHYLMREAIAQYLEREETAEEERRITLDRWQKYELTGEAVDHKQVSKWIETLIAGESAPLPISKK